MSIATDLERAMLDLINAERTARGLDPLRLELNLGTSSDAHSNWMLATNTFSHTGQGGSSPTTRMIAADFDLSGSWGTAENIAAVSVQGASSYDDEVQRLHNNLMNSAGHRANILNPNLEFIGIGISVGPLTYSQGTFNSVIVTQNFAYTGGLPDLDLAGDAANNKLTGEGGDDHIDGLSGNDTLDGGQGTDTVIAGAGHDKVWGRDGNDSLIGNSGDDTVRGGNGNDLIEGDNGNDNLYGQGSGDTITGGAGNDTVIGGGGADDLSGDKGADSIRGGTQSDILRGGDDNDTLAANRHDDTLLGGAGNDVLNGGGDNDRLIGGSGNDWIKGGGGNDVFVFALGDGSDTIDDFRTGTDTLEIDAALANGQSAQAIQNAATVTADGVLIQFGGIDSILLDGLTSTAGLSGDIVIV